MENRKVQWAPIIDREMNRPLGKGDIQKHLGGEEEAMRTSRGKAFQEEEIESSKSQHSSSCSPW